MTQLAVQTPAPTTTVADTAPASFRTPLFCAWNFNEAGKFVGASWRIDS